MTCISKSIKNSEFYCSRHYWHSTLNTMGFVFLLISCRCHHIVSSFTGQSSHPVWRSRRPSKPMPVPIETKNFQYKNICNYRFHPRKYFSLYSSSDSSSSRTTKSIPALQQYRLLGLNSHKSHGLRMSNDNNIQPTPLTDPIVKQTSSNLRRISWLSWWAQVILTTVSSVIFIFARSVFDNIGTSPWQPSHGNFILAGSGILMSFLSIFWTWGGGARLSRRIVRLPTTKIQAANMLRRAIRVGVTLNLIGMFIILIGMEQTVGTLAVKVLTVRPWSGGGGSGVGGPSVWAGVQPLDILVVQANTNSILSHFCSLVAFLYLTKNIEKLDPSNTATTTTPAAT